jgi:hypothetical protein
MSSGFELVAPPFGALVSSLPSGATQTTVGGSIYWTASGVFYRPYYSGSGVVFQIVKKPS